MRVVLRAALAAFWLGFVLVASLGASGVSAQSPKDLVGLATYSGKDREQVLVAGAKKEGALNLYSSLPVKDLDALTRAFEVKYGIKVTTWRGSSEGLVRRVLTESQAGKLEADVIETNGQAIESLQREGVLQKANSPYAADLVAAAVQPHGAWIGTRMDIFVQAYNTTLVKQTEVPKSYQDLLDPRWKGRLGIEAEDVDWFAALVRELGEQRGIKLFRDIVAKNGISTRKGHTLLVNLVASGEVPMALTVYNYTVDRLKRDGAPLQAFTIAPVIARVSGVGVPKRAARPHAALLFYDFMITDGQRILQSNDYVPTSKKLNVPEHKMALKFVDFQVLLENGEKWTRLYEEIFVQKSGAR